MGRQQQQPGQVWLVGDKTCMVTLSGNWWHPDLGDFKEVPHHKARPLVVIDPESDADVDRVADLIRKHHRDDSGVQVGIDWLKVQQALREFAEPTTVYTHYPEKVGDDGIVVSLCGKVWRPNAHAVSEGRCPECVAAVESGWVK